MLAGFVRPDDRSRRTQQVRVSPPSSGFPPASLRRGLPALVRLRTTSLPSLLVLGSVFGVLALACSAVDTAHAQARTTRPRPVIQQVHFNEAPLSFDQDVTAGPGSGNLEIQFAAPESAAPDRAHLRYRLLGLDLDWTDAGKERQAIYNKLPPGHYVFELEELDAGNTSGPGVASLRIEVIPQYWQTVPFRTMCAILLALFGLTAWKLRVHNLIQRAKNLELQVSQAKGELQLAKKVADDAQRALKEQALTDSLTEFWNRRAIFAMLDREICRAQRDHLPITLVMIDLDHFKAVNDTHGHLAGDAVLQESAQRISQLMRPYDFAGRYGGEEFLIVLSGCSPTNGLQRAEDFRRAIADTAFPTPSGPLTVTCSLGVASHDGTMPIEDLIHLADQAMYRAKRLGRNRVHAADLKADADNPCQDDRTTVPAAF